MAELTATILTLAGAAVTIRKIIRSVKTASQELLALANEITDLQLVFDEIEGVQEVIQSQYVTVVTIHMTFPFALTLQ
jgi:hypothetical protein